MWAQSIMNLFKLSHSLWLISLCLSRILLPVFRALQWADDCLGWDYYTNLSTALCQALSPRPSPCLSVCVFLGFITFSLHNRICLLVCCGPFRHIILSLYVSNIHYAWVCIKCVKPITKNKIKNSSIAFPRFSNHCYPTSDSILPVSFQVS